MYESRLHATNGIVSIALDVRNAEVLELVNEKNMDNITKSNCHPKAWTPFMLEIPDGKNRRHLVPPRYLQIMEDPSLQPKIEIDQQEKSASIHIAYNAVMEGNTRRDVKVDVDILLPEGSCKSEWKIRVENHMGEEIQRVLFPLINGIFLGETWEDDQIAFPAMTSSLIKNPVERLASPSQHIFWKWQEYNYGYAMSGPHGAKDDRDSYICESSQTMLWLDLFDEAENCGVYLTCRNNNREHKTMRMETFGECSPTLGISVVHYPCLEDGSSWESEQCILALHEGDWHWGADEYREWHRSLPKDYEESPRPEWFLKNPGLVAHYDFKYQGGGIVHTFKDIPGLLDQALTLGLDHILLSGWNYDGFDNGFPQYWPDPDLGTPEELRDAVHEVRARGGHVSFYVNSRIANIKYEDRKELIDKAAVMNKDGSLSIELYGAADRKFATMCPQTEEWRGVLKGALDYLTKYIGADCLYYDQLSSGAKLCYHPGHHEHAGKPYNWNLGYRKLLKEIHNDREDDYIAVLGENCGDLFADGMCGQLNHGCFRTFEGAAPEVFCYTFPEYTLMEMLVPKHYSGMRAAHAGLHSTYLMYRAFVTGMYLWVYDLEMDNTFRREPAHQARLARQCRLRRAWLENYGQGTFRDNVGLTGQTDGLLVKRFDLENGMLVAMADEKGIQDKWAQVIWEGDHAPVVTVRTSSAPDTEADAEYELIHRDGKSIVCVHMNDADELAVFVLK